MPRAATLIALSLLACGDDPETPPNTPNTVEGVQLIGRYSMARAADFDVSDDGNLAAVSAWTDGTVHLVDVGDPERPALLASIGGGYNADVQLKDTTLYVAHEDRGSGEYEGFGLRIYDVTDPAEPVALAQLGFGDDPGLQSCHNVWPPPDRELLFCASTYNGRVVVLSTGEVGGSPAEPVVLGSIQPPVGQPPGGGAAHDMFARGDLLYSAWLDGGLSVHDISDPSNPVLLDAVEYAGAVTHNVWPDPTGEFLYSTDELPGGHIRVWDAHDLARLVQVGEFQPYPAAIAHDVEVVGDLAFIAHYTAGLVVAELSDPIAPREVAVADFFDGPDSASGQAANPYDGAWGVEGRPPLIYVSGIDSGLWIYRLEDN